MKKILLLPILAMSILSCNKQYYSSMYETVGEKPEEKVFFVDTVKVTPKNEVIVDDEIAVADSVDKKQVELNNVSDEELAAVSTAKITATDDKYASNDGKAVTQKYHVVVGSFGSKINAGNMLDTLLDQGRDSQIAVNQKGLYRVFYYSCNNEQDARKNLAIARKTYKDAWLLMLK